MARISNPSRNETPAHSATIATMKGEKRAPSMTATTSTVAPPALAPAKPAGRSPLIATSAMSPSRFAIGQRPSRSCRCFDLLAAGGLNVLVRAPPQSGRCDIGAGAQRGELRPHHVLGDPLAAREGAEAAVGRGDDALALADRRDGLLEPLGHHLGVL